MKTKYIIILLCIALLSIQFPQEVIVQGTLDSSNIIQKISSEEEEVDNFLVVPTYRWPNVTTITGTDEHIEQRYSINTYSNETGVNSKFERTRQLNTRDFEMDSRFIVDSGGNQTEYSRDVIGNEWGFTTDNDLQDWSTTSGVTTDIVNNGILVITTTGGSASITLDITGLDISTDIYHQFKIKIRYSTIGDDKPFFRFKTLTANGNILNANTITTEWVTWDLENIDNDAQWIPDITGLRIFLDDSTDGTVDIGTVFYIDFIQLIGDFDFATHSEDIGDTWDWEVENDTQDWNGNVDSINVTNGIMTVRTNAGTDNFMRRDIDEIIDTTVFSQLVIKLNDSGDSLEFELRGKSSDDTFVDLTPAWIDIGSGNVEHTIDLTDDSDWLAFPFYKYVYFAFRDSDGSGLEGDETLGIDYFLLLGEWDTSSFKFGITDYDNIELGANSFTYHNSSHYNYTFSLESIYAGQLSYTESFVYSSTEWLRFNFECDLENKFIEVKLEYDNGTDIFDYTQYEMITLGISQPDLFSTRDFPSICINNSQAPFQRSKIYLDFIDAPYQIIDWQQPMEDRTDLETFPFTQDLSDYESYSPYGSYFENNRTNAGGNLKISYYYLLDIDRFDGLSWTTKIEGDDLDTTADSASCVYELCNVQENGTLLTVAWIMYFVGQNVHTSIIKLYDPYGTVTTEINSGTVSEAYEDIELSISMFMDYPLNKFIFQVDADEPAMNTHEASVNWSIDFTREFVLYSSYTILDSDDTDNDIWRYQISQFDVVRKDILSGIVGAILDPLIGVLQLIFSPIILVFLFVGGIFRDVGRIIVEALGEGFAWLLNGLEPLLSAIPGAINQIQGWLNTIAGVITGAINQIQGWLNTIAGVISDAIDQIEGWLNTAIGLIQGWVEAIILNFIAGAQDLVEAILLGLVNLFLEAWDFVVGLIFFVWDLLGLPDVLAIAAVGIDGIVAILLGAPAFILEVINDWILIFGIPILCFYWLWLVFLAFADEGFEPLSGFGNFVDRLLVTYDLTILGVGPLPIPIALFFIPMTYFLIIVPSGSIFAIW